MWVACPGTDVDDVEGLVEKGKERGQLRKENGILDVKEVGGERSGWWEGEEAEMNVLLGVVRTGIWNGEATVRDVKRLEVGSFFYRRKVVFI